MGLQTLRPETTPTASAGNNGTPAALSLPVAEARMESGRTIDFRHLWHTLSERAWILAVCVVAGLALALAYLARTPPLYQGHIVLEVEFAEPTVVANDDTASRMRSMFLASQEALRTIEQNLANRSLLARVIRAEGLADDEGRALLGGGKAPSRPARAVAASSTKQTGSSVLEKETTFTPTEEALGGALFTMVKPVIRRGTRLIDLYVTNRDPVMASRLAEAVGREYIRNTIERRASFTQDTLRFLLEEEERLKGNLQRSEAAVAEYKEQTPDALQLGGGAAATGTQPGAGAGGTRGGLVEDKLQELSAKLMGAKTDRLRLEGELRQVEEVGDDVNALLAIPSIENAPVVADRRRDLSQMESNLATLAQRYKEKHPKMMAARAGLTEAQDTLRRAVLEQPSVLRNTVEQSRSAEKNLEAAAHEQEKAALALNKAAIRYQELARQAETDRALYESVLRQIKEADLSKGLKTTAVSIVEHSLASHTPVSPNTKKSVALGLLGGLAAGLGIIFGLNALDRSIKTVDQAENALSLPVLAAVPEMKRNEAFMRPSDEAHPPGSAGYRLMAEAPEGPAAEAFRNLRAALSLLGPEAERKVSLFTSAMPAEGKSFTSANYALALAQQGYRVLLIDGDLRRPSLQKIFIRATPGGNGAAEPEVAGVVDYLIGEITLANAVHPVAAPDVDVLGRPSASESLLTSTGGGLYVLTGGRRAPNPAELLSGNSFHQLVDEAAQSFDRVVIDSAPVLAVSDTLLMAPHVHNVCMVVRAAKTARNAVQRALALLSGSGKRPAGIILNRLPRRSGTGYYYYYASHGYGAGEGSYSGGYVGRDSRG
jgi:capsular exopolysaccharide synthesis family protein